MVTLARGVTETAPSRNVPPTAHGHGEHGNAHVHAPRPSARLRMSLLRMGLPVRLAFAAGATVVLWSAIALGLS